MILAIDVGNTNIVAALMENGNILASDRFETGKQEQEGYHLKHLHAFVQKYASCKPTGCIIASVVPSVNEFLMRGCESLIGSTPLMVSHEVLPDVKVRYDFPEKLGADLVADAYGAMCRYGAPVCVIDIGTATTFSIMNEKKEYLGGVIAPGPYTSMRGLVQAASLLPDTEFTVSDRIYGKNTVECMNIGLFTTHAAMIDGMIERINDALQMELTYVITGGPAKDIVPLCKKTLVLDDDLLHYGLYCIYMANRN